MRTRQERRNRTIRFIIVGVLVVIILVLGIDNPLRMQALQALQFVELLKNVGGKLSAIALTLVVFFLIVENAEKATFIWETAHKLLGYDLEGMAQREREFTDLPEDYISRPEIERQLTALLKPGTSPRVVAFTGASDSGKTTVVQYLIPRALNRPYKGKIIFCRGDLESIERVPDEDEVHLRMRLIRRILQRIIKEAKVPGDIGETLAQMHEAISEHFEREQAPYLIIIDQVDDPTFRFGDILPSLYGAKNVVLVVGPYLRIADLAGRGGTMGGREIDYQSLDITPFTEHEAERMFAHEMHKRHIRLGSDDKKNIRELLHDTTPGEIQRFADIYANGGGIAAVRLVLQSRGSLHQEHATEAVISDQIKSELHAFLAIFDLVVGDTIGETVLEGIADDLCRPPLEFNEVKRLILRQRYLRPLPVKGKSKQTQRYVITKLGRAVGAALIANDGHRLELHAGAALLDFYRQLIGHTTEEDLQLEIPNILGMMTWATSVARLPEQDIITFTHLLRHVFYQSGYWETGRIWLPVAAQAASVRQLHRISSDLLAAHARILLAAGHVTSTFEMLERARAATAASMRQTRQDQRIGIFSAEQLRSALLYDHLQLQWIAHLRITAERLMLDAQQRSDAHAALLAEAQTALAWLHQHREAEKEHASFARLVQIELTMDVINVLLMQGDAHRSAGNHPAMLRSWQEAQHMLNHARALAHNASNWEALAQIWRVELKLHHRRLILTTAVLGRFLERRQGVQDTIRSLESARHAHSPFEEAITYYENALFAVAGLPPAMLAPPSRAPRLVGLSLRQRRFTSIQKQLLIANATASARGALAHQLLIQLTLIDISLRMYAIDGLGDRLKEARGFAESARTIAQRLHAEVPDLQHRLDALPAGLLLPLPAPALVARA